MEHNLVELERLIDELAGGHARLAELVEQQRQAMRKSDSAGLERIGQHIESEIRRIAAAETARRQLCLRLTGGADAPPEASGRLKLEDLCGRLDPGWAARLRRAAARLSGQIDRVRRAGRINRTVADRLADFLGQLIGRIVQAGRETGCYDARGRRALTGAPIGASVFHAVG